MESEVKEKVEQVARKVDNHKSTVSMSIHGIPVSVHRKVEKFKRQISSERQRDFTIKEAYREFLIHVSKLI